jgi:hypothetical protein
LYDYQFAIYQLTEEKKQPSGKLKQAFPCVPVPGRFWQLDKVASPATSFTFSTVGFMYFLRVLSILF